MRHPVAWWAWALGLAAAASRGTSPAVTLLTILGVAAVAGARRDPAASRVLRMFAVIAGVAFVLRLLGLLLFGSGSGTTVLLDLPSAALGLGITIGGPVTAESLASVTWSTLQLAAILACFGAAAELGPPRRLLPHLPAGLYEVGTAVVVALTFAPQLADHAAAVRTARRLRSREPERGIRGLAQLAAPVLDASLDRSVSLAASMESRGFGRNAAGTKARRRFRSLISMGGLVAVVAGVYGLLNTGTVTRTTGSLLAIGLLAVVAGLVTADGSPRTRYRRDPWGWSENLLLAGGFAAVVGASLAVIREPALMTPDPGNGVPWPPVLACLGVLVAVGCALATPSSRATHEVTPVAPQVVA